MKALAGTAFVLALGAVYLVASAPAGANAQRGRLLYESQCKDCHDTSVHNRSARLAKDFEGIRVQVARWNKVLGGGWTEQDITDVADYLNGRFYQYTCPDIYCNQVRSPLNAPVTNGAT